MDIHKIGLVMMWGDSQKNEIKPIIWTKNFIKQTIEIGCAAPRL